MNIDLRLMKDYIIDLYMYNKGDYGFVWFYNKIN